MNQIRKRELRRKYKINSVGSGNYGEGFYDCLEFMDKNYVFAIRPKANTKGAKR